MGPAVDEVAPHVDSHGAFLDKVRERVGFSAVGALRGRVDLGLAKVEPVVPAEKDGLPSARV